MSITLGKVIELVDEIKPNDFSNDAKTAWLNECEGMVQTEVWLIAIEEVITYSYEENKDTALLVEAPHSKIYEAYLTARIDYANGEYKKYQNTMQMFNQWYREYMRWYATRYRPADKGEDPWKGHYFTAYGIAVKHGFQGSEEDWLNWLYEPKAAADAAYEKAVEVLGQAEDAAEESEKWASTAETAAEAATLAQAGAEGAKSQVLAAAQAAKASAELAQSVAREMTDADYMARLSDLESTVADILYEPIDITSCSVSPSVAELGAVVQAVTVSWGINKTPVSQTLDGESVDTALRSKQLTGLSVTSDTSFTVKAVDERDAEDTANVWIRFYNGVYSGVLADGAVINSAAILDLTRALQAGKAKTFTVTAGAAQRIVYALPKRYGTPAFNVGGFDGGFHLAATFNLENASGYTEEYCVWLSDNLGLGQTTVKVT